MDRSGDRPGTDWIESIFIKMHGPEMFTKWHRGELAWTSQEMRAVWNEFGKIVANPDMIYGGSSYVLSTNFGSAHGPVFREDPAAVLQHQATFLKGFISDQFPDAKLEKDFDVCRFPRVKAQYENSAIVSGDVCAVFNHTPQSKALLRYVSTAEAQSYWLETGAISPNRRVTLDEYQDVIIRQTAEMVRQADIVVFDADDQMPSELQSAFWNAIMDYVSDPSKLDSILQELERVRKEAY